jgi:hypothetical protein
MKNIFNYTIKMLAIVLLLSSCSEDFLDVNTDPNNPTTVSPDLLLPVGLKYSSFTSERNRGQNTLGNMLMQNWSQSDGYSWYNDEFSYLVTSSFYDQIWDYTYLNALKQYNDLTQSTESPEFGYYNAIGEIMKAYHFGILVDTYGDIPYFEALQRGGNPTPSYDDAQLIYDDLAIKLNAAIASINATAANTEVVAVIPGAEDGLFGGDMDMWIQFANSIKLRMAARQSDMGTDLSAYLSGVTTSSVLSTDAINNIGYLNEANKQNPKWEAFGADVAGTLTNNHKATCASQFVLDHLMATNDPRIDFIYEKPATGHLGVIQGLLDYDIPIVDQFDPAFVSNIGPGILRGATQGAVLMTAAEVFFNLAELQEKGELSGSAQASYEMGIEASFSYLGAGSSATYSAQSGISWTGSSNKQEAIITQKWTALNGIDAIQSWFDYSRTGYPSNLPISTQATTSERPVRLAYPSSEITGNASNVPAQPNAFSSKIFWAN